MFTVFIPVYVFLFLPVVSVFRGQATGFLASVSELQWGIMISIFCISHVPALMLLHIRDFEGGNVLLIAFLLLVVQSSDVLQYVWGKLIGRRKIAPSLSPSKTIEGFVGGIVCATALGASLWWITPFSIPQAALIAFSLALLGFAGGLVMSAIKRDRGVKDWGYIIKGHGGVLDRLELDLLLRPYLLSHRSLLVDALMRDFRVQCSCCAADAQMAGQQASGNDNTQDDAQQTEPPVLAHCRMP